MELHEFLHFIYMSSLPHYLRANRMRLGLSQEDIAFLLGVKSGGKISRYESFNRTASLEVALACEVIFQRAVSEIFTGLYGEIEKKICTRAKALSQSTKLGDKSQKAHRRQQILKNIASGYKN